MVVDLISGEVRGQASEYNAQISRGEDVISRIIFASKGTGDLAVNGITRRLFLAPLEPNDTENLKGWLIAACFSMQLLNRNYPPRIPPSGYDTSTPEHIY